MELTNTTTVVAAGTARAVVLHSGERVQVTDVEGAQVGDVFAFAAGDPDEYLSASHTRTVTGRLFPEVGERFVTNRRRPILTFLADTSPGVHDMLIAACDRERYRMLGAPQHRSCADNLREVLAATGITIGDVPQPVNIFMNIPIAEGGHLSWLPAVSRAGDAVTFEADMDCVLVVSSCPMDLNGINGDRVTALALELAPASKEVNA